MPETNPDGNNPDQTTYTEAELKSAKRAQRILWAFMILGIGGPVLLYFLLKR